MQHYIHYGLGFEGSLLSEEEADVLLSTNSDNVRLISFTEDYESRDWASVVVKDCGEITNSGKFSTWNNLKKMCSQEVIIDVPTKEYVLKISLNIICNI